MNDCCQVPISLPDAAQLPKNKLMLLKFDQNGNAKTTPWIKGKYKKELAKKIGEVLQEIDLNWYKFYYCLNSILSILFRSK